MEFTVQQLLDRLQSCDECQRIEAKESKTALGKSALETISAFSNEPGLGGGYLVLGLKPTDDAAGPRYTIIGVNDPDKIQRELAGVCGNTFNIQIRPEIKVEMVNGHPLMIAFIPEALPREKPVFIRKHGADKGAYRRIGSADYHCTTEDLDLLYQLRSGTPYEREELPGVSWVDIDTDVIHAYRRRRAQVEPEAAELELTDVDLLQSLGCITHYNGKTVPNIAGLLLFGTKAVLRRMLPMDARVDYIVTEGPEWVGDPSTRFYSTDYREPLITLLPRLHAQIMGDLPTRFHLETGQLQRSDIPSIPRDVIREALANALMHRDYRVGQPTQVIRYSNRLEFRNAGYSLKPFEELGQSGSKPRNPIIASVFHELRYAETKGTGIRTMRKLMKEAGLTTPPIIETDRDRNEFDLVLLPHHLLDQKDLEWLSQFRELNLTDAERRAIVVAREMRAITNLDYRQINGTDTLTASRALGHLRDLGLLTMKGAGNGTYYILGPRITEAGGVNNPDAGVTPHISALSGGLTPHISALSGGVTPHISALSGELTPHTSTLCKGLDAIPKGFPRLSDELTKQIASLGGRCKSGEIKDLIKGLCSHGPLQLTQLAQILGRDPKYLRDQFLSKMIKSAELVYQYPDQPAHPHQAYKAPKGNKE